MRLRSLIAILAALSACTAAWAHRAPNSVVSLDFAADTVHGEFYVPVSELAHATAAERAGEEFPAYLLRHVAARTPAGAPWRVDIRSVRRASTDGHDYWVASLELTPPRGASARVFEFFDDAVTHEVRNHVVTVLARSDAAAPADIASSRLLGVLQYPARSLTIRRP
jgi:hypothetical protein